MRRIPLLLALLAALPAPAAARPSLLTAEDEQALAEALRWAGLVPGDLGFSRDYINYGVRKPRDIHRLPAAVDALRDPFALPAQAAALRKALGDDLAVTSTLSWAGVFRFAEEQLAPEGFPEDPCATGLPGEAPGVIARAAEHAASQGDRWPKRHIKDVEARMAPRLDRIAGGLLAEAELAGCRVEAALKGLDEATRADALALVVATLANEDEKSEAERDARYRTAAAARDAIDLPLLLAAGNAWTRAVVGAAGELALLDASGWPEAPMILPTALGEVWIGSAGSNAGSGDPVLLLDPGGDDHWRIHPGKTLTEAAQAAKPVRGWIDLGGDDAWRGGALAAGGALFGVAAGVDLGGDDLHRTGSLAQGAAAFGVSTWIDLGGADRYDAATGAQGWAFCGLAALRDRGASQDLYRADLYAQASAGFQAVALLHDDGGPDRYLLGGAFTDNPNRLPGYASGYGQGFAIGMRPFAGGGVAWLVDDGGHDVYEGGLYVQGSSYWHAVGGLLDQDGNDLYSSVQYSQGSGIHLSSAGLFDLGGDDRYLTLNLGQGSGHDLAVSWLLDGGGDDLYSGKDTVQGAAINNAVSFFVDRSGDDVYSGPSSKWTGRALPSRAFGSVGLFVDGSGTDRYLGPEAPEDGAKLPRGEHGAALDLPRKAAEGLEAAPRTGGGAAPTDAAEARALLVDNVRWIAAGEDTRAAVDRVFRGGPDAVAWVLPLASGDRLLQSYTVDELVGRWAKDGSTEARLAVAEAVADAALALPRADHDDTPRWHLRWLGTLAQAEVPASGPAVRTGEALRDHPAWRVRKAARLLLRDIASLEGLTIEEATREAWMKEAAAALTTDPVPESRVAAALLLSAVGGPGAAGALAELLTEADFALRDAAELALAAILDRARDPSLARVLFPLATGERAAPAPGRDAALRLLGRTGHREAGAVLEAAMADGDPVRRLAAVRGAQALGGRGMTRALAARLEVEADPAVRAALQAASDGE